MKSKKALFALFKRLYNKDLSLKDVSNETYGKKSFIYIYNCQQQLGVDRQQVIKDLVENGFPQPSRWGTDPSGFKEGQGLEIRVSYFKGWHWDE